MPEDELFDRDGYLFDVRDLESTRYCVKHDLRIDDGQLRRRTPDRCFVLGVEWGRFYSALQLGPSFRMTVHGENVQRLSALCRNFGREFNVEKFKDLRTAWASFTVDGAA